jgi:hypothetical protein
MKRQLLVAALLCAACSSTTKHAGPPTTTTSTPAPPAAVSNLIVNGVSPGVEQAPFYPATTVTYVACGPVPGGNFLEFIVPPGTAPGYTQSAMANATAVIVVPGEAVLVDRTGKTLYQQKLAGITTGTQGALVLSLTNATSTSGAGGVVESGAVDVSGTFKCAITNAKYPGL